jgi:hypothetical protein
MDGVRDIRVENSRWALTSPGLDKGPRHQCVERDRQRGPERALRHTTVSPKTNAVDDAEPALSARQPGGRLPATPPSA